MNAQKPDKQQYPTEPIVVTLPITETPEERKARQKLHKPLPHYSFMVSGNARGRIIK